MEDLHAAGGIGAVLRELKPLLHLDTMDVEGRILGDRLAEPLDWVDRTIIRPFPEPVSHIGGLIALRGSLAPDGAIFKRAAASRPVRKKVAQWSSQAWKTWPPAWTIRIWT